MMRFSLSLLGLASAEEGCPQDEVTLLQMNGLQNQLQRRGLSNQAGESQRFEGVTAPTMLLSGAAECPQCTCELSQPDGAWGSQGSGCLSAFDGDITWSPGTGVHIGMGDTLTLTFPGPMSIGHIELHQIYHRSHYNPNFSIETFYDGDWTVLTSHGTEPGGWNLEVDAFQFEAPVLATQVRLSTTRGILRLKELQVFGRPQFPDPLPVMLGGMHYSIDGCSLYGADGEHPLTGYNDATTKADVRCCSSDGLVGRSQNFEGGVEFGGSSGCMFDKTFFQARAICLAAGMRLCDQHEVDVACRTGCRHDVHAVWISMPTPA